MSGSSSSFFKLIAGRLKISYVVTLHGPYEVTEIGDPHLVAFLRGVDHWIYTAQKNLQHFEDIPVAGERLIPMSNALIINEKPFDYAREELNIDPETLIFGVASRAVKEKG
jgi:hypothetical protein